MKKLPFFLGLMMLFLCACSQLDENDLRSGLKSEGHSSNSTSHISEADAIQIANSVISSMSTRSENAMSPSVDYVVKSGYTRSMDIPDTLAYVFNYPGNSGFAIISTDSRVEPLLAYSNEGNLDLSDEFVRENILLPTEEYISTQIPANPNDVPLPGHGDWELGYRTVETMSPIISMNLKQYAPWNKKIVEALGGDYVTGCVPVASIYIMTYCKPSFTFNGKYYNAAEIVKCIAINQGATGLGTTNYSYSLAVDQIAQLLFDFGRSIGAKYKYNEVDHDYYTEAYSSVACNKLISSSFSSPTNLIDFNFVEHTAVDYLKSDYLLYMQGRTTDDEDGHAWVSDGYELKTVFNQLPNLPAPGTIPYLHFNWGWNGLYNGYFYSKVYSVAGYNLVGQKYCAFKISK